MKRKVRYFRMNENQNEIQNENQEQSQEPHKHFLTLHISHKGQQKTLHFRIRHAVAVCAATVFLVGGSVCAVGAYQKTKTDLHTSKEQLLETERERRKLEQRAELLETENTEYTENIDALQNKTTELEQKMNEIESVKEDLYHQITNLDESDSSASLDLTAMTSALAPTEGTEAAAPTFTTLVSTSYNKASALSTHLDKMSLLMDETSISFSAVADTVTYLAALSNAPSGWPVDSRTVSTEFNPSADPSISDGRKHYGMDISTQSRIIPIYATASGTVVTAQYHSEFGNYVVIDHGNGFTTLYAHCTDLNVAVGDKVKKGDTIVQGQPVKLNTDGTISPYTGASGEMYIGIAIGYSQYPAYPPTAAGVEVTVMVQGYTIIHGIAKAEITTTGYVQTDGTLDDSGTYPNFSPSASNAETPFLAINTAEAGELVRILAK